MVSLPDKVAIINGIDYTFYHCVDGGFRLRKALHQISESFLRKAKEETKPLTWIVQYCQENNIDVTINEC